MNTAAFTDILRRELGAIQSLSDLLVEEFAAMGSGNTDVLEDTLKRKAILLEQLQRLSSERVQGLQTAGVSNTQSAIEAWLKNSGEGLRLWQDLMARTREVHKHHQANQALLEGLMRCNQQTLDLLVRLASPEQTYEADGRTTGSFGPRSRGTA